MFKKFSLALAIAAGVAMSACSPQPAPVTEMRKIENPAEKVSFNTLEDARTQARDNALWNAKAYLAENPRFDEGFKVVSHGDSTQDVDCPQGDGWATVSIMKVNGKVVEKYVAKCSTVSGSLGCYLENDFTKKPFSKEENQCQPRGKVPFPIPKIVK
jgi:hypothetical protein